MTYKNNTNYWALLILIGIVLVLFNMSWWWIDSNIDSIESRGQFGDKTCPLSSPAISKVGTNLADYLEKGIVK